MKKDSVQDLISELAAKPTTAIRSVSPTLTAVIVSIFLIAFILLLGLRKDIFHILGHPIFLLEGLALLAISLTSFYTAWRLFSVRVPVARFLTRSPLWGFLGLLVLYAGAGVSKIVTEGIGSCGVGFACLITSTAFIFGLAGVLSFVSYRYRSVTLKSSFLYLAIGISALSLLALRFSCNDDSLAHILMWHVLPVFGVFAAFVLIIFRTFRFR